MKVLVFTTLFPNSKMPNHGIFVKTRVKNLAKVCDVRVIAPIPHFPKININKKWFKFSQVPTEEEIDGLKVYHPRYFVMPKFCRSLYAFFMFIDVLRFVKRIKKEFDFDVIDGHFIYPDGLAAVLLGAVLRKKVIVTARGTDINWYSNFWIIRTLIRYCLKRADAVISVNSDLKNKMVELGIDADKIKVINNGVDFSKFYAMSKTEAKRALGIANNKKVLLSAGNLIETKGFHILINAFSLIKNKDAVLYIIGEGPYRKNLEALIARVGLKDRIMLVGEVPHNELYKWYSAADLFCLTSLREGWPNVILESLSCGTPALTMNKWSLSELIDKNMGILLDSYEPVTIAMAIEVAIDRQWDGKSIAGNMQNYSWDDTTSKLSELFKKTLQREDVLFFSSDDWNSGLKTSKYHIATRLARDSRVFFINSIGLRTPSVTSHDFKRVIAKIRGFFKGVKQINKNLFVYTPIAVPFQKHGFVRFMNNMIITFQIKMIMRRFNIKRPAVWTFLPNSLGVIRKIERKRIIYYCVDDMSAFKGVPADVISRLDSEMTRQADIVFAVSQELFKKKKAINENTFYSPHGVDFELFNKAVVEKGVMKPADIEDIGRPIIGFYGLISGDWIDYDLIRFLAQKRPAWSFVFVGKIDAVKEGPPRANNIYYLSVKPYEELYKYSRFFDVAMLPFNINQLTMHSHPLKILEYLSAGKPVVSIAIPEVMRYADVIEIAARYEEFLDKIERSLKLNDRNAVESRVRFASSNSWEKRFDEIQKAIAYHM
ncbi:MAG: glycosyltransferase [Candidatus Omnitrophota bacterium]|nr:glycosyltransferase [Candidatus Omnitrophota bacterium]